MKEKQWKFFHTLYYFLFPKKNKEKKTVSFFESYITKQNPIFFEPKIN